jgi:hypothetical protein
MRQGAIYFFVWFGSDVLASRCALGGRAQRGPGRGSAFSGAQLADLNCARAQLQQETCEALRHALHKQQYAVSGGGLWTRRCRTELKNSDIRHEAERGVGFLCALRARSARAIAA